MSQWISPTILLSVFPLIESVCIFSEVEGYTVFLKYGKLNNLFHLLLYINNIIIHKQIFAIYLFVSVKAFI